MAFLFWVCSNTVDAHIVRLGPDEHLVAPDLVLLAPIWEVAPFVAGTHLAFMIICYPNMDFMVFDKLAHPSYGVYSVDLSSGDIQRSTLGGR